MSGAPNLPAPRVTVLMPAYNAAAFLAAAIGSVLAQTFRDFELLIIDDGSTDSTREIVQGFRDGRIRLLANEGNRGLIFTLNRGLREAHGEFIARLDADDLALPQRLERQVDFLTRHREIMLLGTLGWHIDETGRVLGPVDLPLDALGIRWSLLFDNCFIHSAVMFRAQTVRAEFGGYAEGAVGSEDFELWSRIARRHPTANLGQRLVELRVHGASIMRAHQPLVEEGTRRNLRTNLTAEFPNRAFAEEEIALLAQYRGTVEPSRLAAFHTLFDELRKRFAEAHPGAWESRALRRTLALQFARIAYNLLPQYRAAALGEYLRCLRAWPPVFAELPWARIIALALLGDSARALYRRLVPARS